MPTLSVIPVRGTSLVEQGSDLLALIRDWLRQAGLALIPHDVVVIAQKIVSKAEGRARRLDGIEPSARARDLAAQCGKDPRFVQLVLDESVEVVAVGEQLLIVEHRTGHVMANAGIDRSNVDQGPGETVLLLPADSNATAMRVAGALSVDAGGPVGVIISDSFGRPFRLGTIGVALGTAGIEPLIDLRGCPDLFGNLLKTSEIAAADSIAAAAVLAMGESNEASPLALVRGWTASTKPGGCESLARPREKDVFR
jgi:coenzyme F420-0:L-glutamate ligase/coenzyme F420-1:gamma-L-glutamate ligase